jgi:hypothetical protein
MKLAAPVFLAMIAAGAAAQNCAGVSTGRVPLDDLGAGLYQGFQGGLYPGAQNVRPPGHEAAGLAKAAAIVPRLPNGAIAPPGDPAGRIVLLSIGMSNTTQEFSTFVPSSNADVTRNPAVLVVDGAQGGQTAAIVSNPNASFWTVIQNRLANAGVTPQQVQACWMKEANASPSQAFPADAQVLQNDLRAICQVLQTKYANLQLCYLSSRIYAGYATTPLNPEPFAYQSGFAVKWLVEAQIGGDPGLNHDPAVGPVLSPWLAWGPYLWADGLVPRSDGLTWACNEFQPDGTHPEVLARFKVAAMLEQFLRSDATATPWYSVATPHAVHAAAFFYGDACTGTGGPPNLVVSGPPALGAAAFSIGVNQARPNAIALVFASLGYADTVINGPCRAFVDASQLFVPDAFTIATFTTSPAGSGFWSSAIPNSPALMALSAYAQVLVADPAGAAFPQFGGAALTRAVRLIVGVP